MSTFHRVGLRRLVFDAKYNTKHNDPNDYKKHNQSNAGNRSTFVPCAVRTETVGYTDPAFFFDQLRTIVCNWIHFQH